MTTSIRIKRCNAKYGVVFVDNGDNKAETLRVPAEQPHQYTGAIQGQFRGNSGAISRGNSDNGDEAVELSGRFSAPKSDYSSQPRPSLLLTLKVTRFFLPRPPPLASRTPAEHMKERTPPPPRRKRLPSGESRRPRLSVRRLMR